MKKNKSTDEKKKNTAPASTDALEAAAGGAEDAEMTEGECQIWKSTEVRGRIRGAVAQWAGIPANDIVSTQQLRQLAPPDDGPWGQPQQNNLIAFTNSFDPPIFRSVVPGDDACQMEALDSLIAGETTVLEWEDIVWRNQRPRTFCRRMFGI